MNESRVIALENPGSDEKDALTAVLREFKEIWGMGASCWWCP
ncbi:MAG: hypothetical protein O7A69_09475 [SAR324 cluster bacterium]|nr:hypothetical protein [SAR324 cluster bacterium]